MKFKRIYRKDLKQWCWGFDVTVAGQRIRRYEWPTKREAEEALASVRTMARAIRYGLIVGQPQVTLQALYEERIADPSLREQRQLASILDGFLDVVDPDTPLLKLSRVDYKNYVAELKTRDLKPATINRYLAAISATLHSAKDYFRELDEWRPPPAPWEPEPLGRERLLSADEISRLLAALRSDRQKYEHSRALIARREVYDLFRLMLLTAAREGELLDLRQHAISWDWRTVQITATKTNTIRVVPLSDTALEILRARQANAPRVFKRVSKDALYSALTRAGDLAGIEYGDRVEGGWVIYDLRHVAATVMENAGIPYSAVAAILGHRRRDQTATYTHTRLETLRRGVEAIEDWCREIDGFISACAALSGTPQTIRRRQVL